MQKSLISVNKASKPKRLLCNLVSVLFYFYLGQAKSFHNPSPLEQMVTQEPERIEIPKLDIKLVHRKNR